MDIEAIYKAYPRHKDKRFALLSIEKALRRIQKGETGDLMTEDQAQKHLMSKTSAFAASLAGNRGLMTPYPATWFNRGGYMDDAHEWDLMSREEYEDAMRTREANVGVWRPS